jgi:hypothetical protein
MPPRLISPIVGLMPTMRHIDDGQTTDPSFSVPVAAAQRFADTATPDPELIHTDFYPAHRDLSLYAATTPTTG